MIETLQPPQPYLSKCMSAVLSWLVHWAKQRHLYIYNPRYNLLSPSQTNRTSDELFVVYLTYEKLFKYTMTCFVVIFQIKDIGRTSEVANADG